MLVFVLALRAKLSLYDPPHPGSVSPAAASKLWVSGEKLKTPALGVCWLPGLAALLLFPGPSLRVVFSEPAWIPAPRHLIAGEVYPFLRPPPSF
ncbi:MAG TPA: hypothetical protein VEE85_01210 [Candidatus Bathyarchaeia archaeon]|nr:hypothetical protein [Candidatus Bathyarchaeia archaeon]